MTAFRRLLPILAVATLVLCGCRAGSPGVRVSVGFLGAEVSVQIGGGDLAPRIDVGPGRQLVPPAADPAPLPVDATPPAPLEDPKDEEEEKDGPGKEGPP